MPNGRLQPPWSQSLAAGGAIAAGVAFRYKPAGRPAFVAPIYPGGEDFVVKTSKMPSFQQRLLRCLLEAATDDQLGLAPESVALYQSWTAAHKSAELHI
jgi:hypothetical protein